METHEYLWDVFISYLYGDRDRVEPIVRRLQDAGFRVFLDTDNIRSGESVSVALERALFNSHTLMIFLSQKALNSQWIDYEVNTFRSLSGSGRKVIPVLLDRDISSDLPTSIKSLI